MMRRALPLFVAWLRWTVFFAAAWFVSLTFLGAIWVSWVPVIELVIEAALLAIGLTVYCARAKRTTTAARL